MGGAGGNKSVHIELGPFAFGVQLNGMGGKGGGGGVLVKPQFHMARVVTRVIFAANPAGQAYGDLLA